MTYFTVLTDSGGLVEVAMPTNLSATDNADFLLGTSAADSINGAGGNDSIYGAAGNDTINGGTGDDVISGGAGNDTLTGGGGNDTFLFKLGDGTDVITDFAAGDGVDVSGYTSAQSVTQVGSNVVVVFDNGDQITFDNTTVSTVQAGLHFLDTPAPTQTPVDPPENLVGTSGNDTLVGGSGNDTLTGLGGNDILNGGAGADTMIGGTGNDTYYVDNPGDVVTEQSGQGTDTVHSTISYTLPNNVENGTLDGTAAINLTGNGLANTLHGNSGDNFLYGMAGNDILVGGAGNDTLRGGLGADTLTGGTGSDTFQFEASNGNDKITDFQSGVDKLDFHLLGITSSSVKEVVSGGNLLLKVDANHDGIVDFTITLTGVTHVVASDFIW
jgi:Ca2+-binding RTX toxin-like protein